MNLTIEDYKQRLDNMFEDVFTTGLKKWKDGDCGDAIPLESWLSSVKSSGFTDYDGFGNFAMKRSDGVYITSNLMVKPTDISKWNIKIPTWATHVVWYNR